MFAGLRDGFGTQGEHNNPGFGARATPGHDPGTEQFPKMPKITNFTVRFEEEPPPEEKVEVVVVREIPPALQNGPETRRWNWLYDKEGKILVGLK